MTYYINDSMQIDLPAAGVCVDGFVTPWDMPRLRGVYGIFNTKTGFCYVGSSNNVRARCMGHVSRLLKGRHPNRHLQAAWLENPKSFAWALLAQAQTVDDLVDHESRFIDILRSAHGDRGYNLVLNPKTGALSDEVRLRMSAVRKGRKAWNKGIPCPQHVILASIKAHTGRVKTISEREKLRAAMLGPSHPYRGKKFPKEYGEKVSRRVRAQGPMAGSSTKGVNLDARTKTFMARIYANGKQIFLGRFPTEIEAAQAYNAAATKYFGDGCFLNPVRSGTPLRRTTRGRPAREAAHV